VVIDVDKEDGVVVGTLIRYRDPAENEYELTSGYGTPDSRRGEKVMIQYDPAHPVDALLAGEPPGRSSHVAFVIGFGLMAVWGAVVALFDPQLAPVTGRPGGLAAVTTWLWASALIGFFMMRGDRTGSGMLLLLLALGVGLILAFGVWRMIPWARWGAITYSSVLSVALIVGWAGNENRLGTPLFTTVALLAIWGSVIIALTRREVADGFDRAHAGAVTAY